MIVPALKKAKVKTGSTAILNITGTDTTAAQAQVDSFIEKWKSEGVNMVFLAGNLVSAKQFAESIKAGLPKATLVTDTDTALDQAKGEQDAGVKPNPYEGMISGTGLTQSERWANKSPILQQCVDIYEKATGETVPGPDERDGDRRRQAGQHRPGGDRRVRRPDDVQGTSPRRSGQNLTTKNWQKTVDSFGTIDLPPNQFSSLCKGKYDAEDSFRLVAYDSSLGASGDWKTLTPVKDASGGKCTKPRKLNRGLSRTTTPGSLARRVAALDRAVVGAEVRRDDARVVADLAGRALGDDRARLEAVDPVADRQDQRQVVLDDDERGVELLLHALDQRAERLGLALRDAGGRLVEADHARRDGEHGRELDDAPRARSRARR